MRQKVLPSEVIVTDKLGSNHVPVILRILDAVSTREALVPLEKVRDWDLLQGLTSELTYPNIEIYSFNFSPVALQPNFGPWPPP
jgi:hypothetical protein